jgi:hypothetical protein
MSSLGLKFLTYDLYGADLDSFGTICKYVYQHGNASGRELNMSKGAAS